MKKFILFLLCMFFCLPGSAQNWTTVTATNITDLNQQKLAAGQLCFLATDQNDNPISIGIGGGGQLLRRAFCAAVANGAVTNFSVPNPAQTAPAGVMYRVTVNDTSVGREVLRYTQVAFTGAAFNFDAYAPTGPGSLPPLGNTVNGNLNVNGNLSITGAFATSQFGNISATAYNNVVEANTQTGADACAQIAAAIAALPTTGGTVDARGIQGAQTCAANPFAASNKPVQLLLGGITITLNACWAVPSNTVIAGAGRGVSTLKLANGVNSCFAISNLHPSTGDNHIAVTGLTIDGNMLNQSPTGSQRTGCVFFERTQYFWIEDNELLNCYNYGVEALGQSQYGWVRGNRIDGTLLGSGVLFGTGPLSTDGTGAIAEAYDMWAEDNWIGNTQADCLFTTGSNTAAAYGTARVHFKNNTLFNCGDVSIEIGDSSRDSEAVGNIIQMPPALTIAAISRTLNVVSATFTCSWRVLGCLTSFGVGTQFQVAGVSDSSFNNAPCTIGVNCFVVSTVNYTTNTLTWAQTAANSSGSGGTVIRVGNQALLGRSSINVEFKGNVVNGTGSAADNGCEMSWHNGGDNAPNAQNHTWDDVCNNMGGTAFKTIADASGTVNQVQHRSKHLGTVGNDYVIGSNTLALRLDSGGYKSSGNAFAGISFNQTNDLSFRPSSGNAAKFIFSATNTGLGVSNGDFTPGVLFHVRSGSGGGDLRLEQTGNSNSTASIMNNSERFDVGIRSGASACVAEAFMFRDVTGGIDEFCIGPGSAPAFFVNSVQSSGLILNNLLISKVAPTISSGFGTSPSLASNNGTASFTVNVGTGGVANSGVIGLPAAVNGWNCYCEDETTFSTTVFRCRQTATTTSTATIGNFNSTASSAAWVASDTVQVSCFAR